MIVTRKWIEAHRTPKGGYSTAQIRALSGSDRVLKGWLENAIGTEISEAVKIVFESGKQGKNVPKKLAKKFKNGMIVKKPEIQLSQKITKVKTKKYSSTTLKATHPDFLQSYAWRQVRMQALIKYGRKCQCCGATPETGAIMNVDHIKPRKTHPELALSLNNLQVLCHECNHGKGNWDTTDWRNIA